MCAVCRLHWHWHFFLINSHDWTVKEFQLKPGYEQTNVLFSSSSVPSPPFLYFYSFFFFYQTNTQKNYNRFAAYCLSSTYKSRYIQYINIGLFFVCSSCYSLFWVSFDFSSSSGSFLSRFFFLIQFTLIYFTWLGLPNLLRYFLFCFDWLRSMTINIFGVP